MVSPRSRTVEKGWYYLSSKFQKTPLPFGVSEEDTAEAKASLEMLLNELNDKGLRVRYYYRILPSFEDVRYLRKELRSIEKKIDKAYLFQALALGFQQTWLYIKFRKIFKDYPLNYSRLFRYHAPMHVLSGQRFVEILRRVGGRFSQPPKPRISREPGERFLDRLMTAFIASWIAFGLQMPVSDKLQALFGSSTAVDIVALVLGYGIAYSFYNMALQSLVNHFVEHHQQRTHWSIVAWVLFPIVIEQAFLLSFTLQLIGYSPAVHPVVMWISAIAGSVFGSTTLAFYARGLAPRVREHRLAQKDYLKNEFPRQQQRYEQRAQQEQERRDVWLDKELADYRKGLKQLRLSIAKQKRLRERKRELRAEHRKALKHHVTITTRWWRGVEIRLLELKSATVSNDGAAHNWEKNGAKESVLTK